MADPAIVPDGPTSPRSGRSTERQPPFPLFPQPRSRHDCQTNSGETGKPSQIAPTHSPPASRQASTARNQAHIVWFFYSKTSYRLTKPNNKCPLEVPIYDVAPVFNGSPFCFFTGRLVWFTRQLGFSAATPLARDLDIGRRVPFKIFEYNCHRMTAC